MLKVNGKRPLVSRFGAGNFRKRARVTAGHASFQSASEIAAAALPTAPSDTPSSQRAVEPIDDDPAWATFGAHAGAVLRAFKKCHPKATSLFAWQSACLLHTQDVHQNALYNLPTSAGKTLASQLLLIRGATHGCLVQSGRQPLANTTLDQPSCADAAKLNLVVIVSFRFFRFFSLFGARLQGAVGAAVQSCGGWNVLRARAPVCRAALSGATFACERKTDSALFPQVEAYYAAKGALPLPPGPMVGALRDAKFKILKTLRVFRSWWQRSSEQWDW